MITITNEPCVYKITSPSGKVYIGQTINLKSRLNKYKSHRCKNQRRLYNSFVKYGYDNHSVDVIKTCSQEELNDTERFYQDHFNSTGLNGLNIRKTKSEDRSGSFPEESKRKMAASKLGVKRPKEVREAISIRMKKLCKERPPEYYNDFSIINNGRKHTKEHKAKNSEAKKGKAFRLGSKHKESSKLKMKASRTGVKCSEETKEKMRLAAINAWKKRKNHE